MRNIASRLFAVALAGAGFAAQLQAEGPAPAVQPIRNGAVSVSDAAQSRAGMRASLDSWLKNLRRRVARTRAHQNQLVAVAAVRGAETPDAPPLYWKGKKASGPVDAQELDRFEKAVESAIAGQPGARAMLQDFISAYPKSPLVGDANAALKKMDAATTP